MKTLLLALSLGLSACSAQGAPPGPVTPATLGSAFGKAQAGDTLALAPGSYGDYEFSRKFDRPVTITCADKARPPSFLKLSVSGASNITFSCLRVDFVPDAKTNTWSWAARIRDSDHIVFSGVKVLGKPAVAGLNEDGSGTEVGGSIVGRPTGYGLLLNHATDVLIENGEVAGFYKGVVLQWTQKVTLRGMELHDMRTTAVVGSDNSDLTVENNHMHSSHPWRWGNGDHADLLALWSNENQTTPNARVRILNNRMEQMAGEAILGMWLQGSKNAPFTDFEIVGNQIVVNNQQGIFVHDAIGGVIADNRLYRATPGDDEQSPTVLLRENTNGVTVKGNQLGAGVSDQSKGDNPASANRVVRGKANIFKASEAP